VPQSPDAPLITIEEVRDAARRLAGRVLRTPLLHFGERDFVKPESLQPTGSFKLRGAYNAMLQLAPGERARGVITHSSGNHGQAVARVARLLGMRAVVVMPDNAPRVKVERVTADGAEIVFVGSSHEERIERANELAGSQGLTMIPSADDRRVIAGQATIGLEIIEQLTEAGVDAPPTVLAPIGQGGLAAGVAMAVKTLSPGARVLGVEPTLAADTQASLRSGRIVRWPSHEVLRTIADGMRMESPAPLPFRHLQRHLDDVLTVEEEEIVQAMARAAAELRLVLEPSGAATLAALLGDRSGLGPGPVVAVLSGGNVDPERYLELLRSAVQPHAVG
jgi:threo-3-hydroxy-L-aspartate ammonia-lyase